MSAPRTSRRASAPTRVAALVTTLLPLALLSTASAAPDDWLAPWPQRAVLDLADDPTLPEGPLRSKALEFEWWQEEYSVPFHGSVIERTHFDGPVLGGERIPAVSGYTDWNDSCEWTGLYLGSQAMRYHVSGSPQARENAIRTARALSRNLHVTGTRGFIARYSAPQDPLIYEGDAWCDSQERCHRVEEGEFAGDWWWGETSRDMYGGWFFGMALAHDLVDDTDMRAQIRADVQEVLDTLIDNDWRILNEIGKPTDSAPNITPPFRISWLLIGYHLTGDERFAAELRSWLLDDQRGKIRFSSISAPNRYTSYYGNALSHELWFNLLRLAKVYLGKEDGDFFLGVFEKQVHSFTRLSHNPFFNAVYMGQGAYEPAPGDPYAEQLKEDLALFPSPPRTPYYLGPRPAGSYELDPVSVFLSELALDFPVLVDLIFPGVKPQALEAFPIDQQCERKLFERSPFTIDACGDDDPARVGSGTDFVTAYWMSAYHGVLAKDQ